MMNFMLMNPFLIEFYVQFRIKSIVKTRRYFKISYDMIVIVKNSCMHDR